MATEPLYFSVLIKDLDLTVLPPLARQPGTDAFRVALAMHFSMQASQRGDDVIVAVDDESVSVYAFPGTQTPLDFGVEMLKAGKLREGASFLEAVVKARGPSAELSYNLGVAYSELGEYDEAVIRLKRSVQFDPQHARAWTALGVAYQRAGKPHLAREPLRKSVEVNPADGYACRNLAAMLLQDGDTAGAVTNFRKAREALPDNPQTLLGLATALLELHTAEADDEANALLAGLVKRWPDGEVAEQAKQALTKLAHDTMTRRGGGLRMDVAMYIAAAFEMFATMDKPAIGRLVLEIGELGAAQGLDINDSAAKYSLKALPGHFSGMHLLSLLYAGLMEFDSKADAGVDFSKEYAVAKMMRPASRPSR